MKQGMGFFVGFFVCAGFAFAAKSKDPFAGRTAHCESEDIKSEETWKFIGMAKEYVKTVEAGEVSIKQTGKYSVNGNTLKIEEFKEDTKEVDPTRKFSLKYQLNDAGFEYVWPAPNGHKDNWTCKWK